MADTPIGPGTVLAGRFTLEDLLDESGGARFWLATDRTLARSVAVHVIAATDPRADALLSAARTSATVTDGHLLRVLDAAVEDGIVYVVNEWGSGVSLDRMLSEGPLSPRRAAWVVKEVAEAISTAHRHGVAHGRLLPENVMVTEAGSVKLIGFVVDAVLRGRDHQLSGGRRQLDEWQADVVNLAGLLYAALVGRWPGTTGSVVPPAPYDHDRPLRPRQVRAGVPRPLDAICDRVLNPEAHEAMPIETAHEVYAALTDYIGDPSGAGQAGFEPTTVLDRDELARARGEQGASTGDRPAPADPEATQAGTPVFYDTDSGVGWMSPGPARGLRADEEPRRPVPPPPPFTDPEPRPLFAPEPTGASTRGGARTPPRRRPGADTGPARSTGPGTGSLPAVWGPDADEPAGAAPADWDGGDAEPPGRSWLRLAAAVAACILLVIALVFAFDLGRDSGDEPSATQSPSGDRSTAATGKPLDIASVSDFDPFGDPPEENGDEAPLAADGDPATAWRTSTYYNNPKLGGLKSGVGLLLDLGRPEQVSRVHLTLEGGPTSLQLLAAPQDAPAPTGIDGLRTLRTVDAAGTDVQIALDQPATVRYLVVWLTSLPPTAGGYAGQVAEITVRS